MEQADDMEHKYDDKVCHKQACLYACMDVWMYLCYVCYVCMDGYDTC